MTSHYFVQLSEIALENHFRMCQGLRPRQAISHEWYYIPVWEQSWGLAFRKYVHYCRFRMVLINGISEPRLALSHVPSVGNMGNLIRSKCSIAARQH